MSVSVRTSTATGDLLLLSRIDSRRDGRRIAGGACAASRSGRPAGWRTGPRAGHRRAPRRARRTSFASSARDRRVSPSAPRLWAPAQVKALLGFASPRPFARPRRRNQARPGARLRWTPREIEHAAFSAGEHLALSENAGLSRARFSVLLFPHRDKDRFVTTLERGAARSCSRPSPTRRSGARRCSPGQTDVDEVIRGSDSAGHRGTYAARTDRNSDRPRSLRG